VLTFRGAKERTMKATATRASSRPTVTSLQLAEREFTPEQITRLAALRAHYPLLEFVESRSDVDRLSFLKWRYATGRLHECV
jgi:hypothetical protein